MRDLLIKNQGFTLIELMAVTAIIGLLVTLASTSYNSYQARARSTEAKILLAELYVQQNDFHREQGGYTSCASPFGYRGPNAPNQFYAMGFEFMAASNCGPSLSLSCNRRRYDPSLACPPALFGSGDTQGMGGAKQAANSQGPATGLMLIVPPISPILAGMPARGMQRGASQSSFTGLALGRISADEAHGLDLWSITQRKILTHERFGY